MTRVAVVVPSNRPEELEKFKQAWQPLLEKHEAWLAVVEDGDDPRCIIGSGLMFDARRSKLPHSERELIYDHTDSVRNLGFLELARLPREIRPEVIITLDDDVRPVEGRDAIQEHLDALKSRVPVSWYCHASQYMRGFPYGVRREAEVWVSHGVWSGHFDWDAPSQLTVAPGISQVIFYQGPVPKGPLMPVCGMNLAFRIEALPWVYFAPMGPSVGVHRFGDIWMGIHLKWALDAANKAMVTGHSVVEHIRASNVFKNLEHEARGIRMNETCWSDLSTFEPPDHNYWNEYADRRLAWEALIQGLLGE